ncbi:MAG: hypothetical protein WDA10_12125 [Porticoccaceae bacterium]
MHIVCLCNHKTIIPSRLHAGEPMNTKVTPEEGFVAFDPFSAEFRADPASFHPQLLEHSPGFIMMEGNVASAYVAKYDQCVQVLSNWELFSSLKPANLPGMQRVDFFNGQPVMNYSDPPDHTRRRRVVDPAFSPGRVRKLADAAERLIDDILGQFEPGQRVDAVNQIGKPLAVSLLFGEFFGVPREGWQTFLDFGATFPLLDKLKPGDPKPQAYLDGWKKVSMAIYFDPPLANKIDPPGMV